MSTPPLDLDVWVLAGQSNMEGCGPLSQALPPDPNVWNFTSAGAWEPAVEPLHRLWESYAPVHQNLMRPHLGEELREWTDEQIAKHTATTRRGGAGLGVSFAKEISRASGKPVGVISAAHGGTSLDQWSPELKNEGVNSLYGAMLDRIQRAGGNLKGILWYQGESDCWGELAGTYANRFDAWVNAVRRDTKCPDLPVLAVQLSRFVILDETPELAAGWDRVRKALIELPDRLPHTAATSAIDLGLSDGIHVGTPGLIRLGRRLAKLALALETGKPLNPRVTSVEKAESPLGHPMLRVNCANVNGGWHPAQHAGGFDLCAPDGAPHPSVRVIDVSVAPDDPSSLLILLTGQINEPGVLVYGKGLNPYCNVVDEADMPLPAFSWEL
jgi:sialate O-acetylesterase